MLKLRGFLGAFTFEVARLPTAEAGQVGTTAGRSYPNTVYSGTYHNLDNGACLSSIFRCTGVGVH